MRKFLGGLVILVACLFSLGTNQVAQAQTDEESSRALVLFEADVSAAGDALRDLDDWAVQHITVTGLTEASRMIDDRSDRLPSTVVLAAGATDSADLSAFEERVDGIVSALSDVDRIIWLDFPELRDRDRAANRILREIARENTEVRVLSWNGAQRSITAYESASGELTPDGTTAMVSLITSELRGRSVGLASGPLFQTATTQPPVTTTTTQAPTTTTTTTTAPPTTTRTEPEPESDDEEEQDGDSDSAETEAGGSTSSTYLTTTTTARVAGAEQSEEATESALAALENAEARAASLEQRDTEPTASSDSIPTSTTTAAPLDDEVAIGVGDDSSSGRGLRQAGALLFTLVIAGFFVAIRRNEFEPYDGHRARELRGPQ